MEFECDYDIYGDTRNRKGKIKQDYNSHNKGYKEQLRIHYAKQKRLEQSLADRRFDNDDEEEDSFDETENSRKRKLKYTADEDDKIYGNNYSPVKKKNKKKKNSKKDKVRF